MSVADLAILAVRGLVGGLLVVAFALVAEVVTPKAFSGLFSAAPSVALASLTITVVADGSPKALQDSIGMVVGAVAMTASCIVAATVIPKVGAFWGSAAAWLGWIVIGFGLYWAVFIGAR